MQIIYFPWTSEQNLKDYIKPTHTKFVAKKKNYKNTFEKASYRFRSHEE